MHNAIEGTLSLSHMWKSVIWKSGRCKYNNLSLRIIMHIRCELKFQIHSNPAPLTHECNHFSDELFNCDFKIFTTRAHIPIINPLFDVSFISLCILFCFVLEKAILWFHWKKENSSIVAVIKYTSLTLDKTPRKY